MMATHNLRIKNKHLRFTIWKNCVFYWLSQKKSHILFIIQVSIVIQYIMDACSAQEKPNTTIKFCTFIHSMRASLLHCLSILCSELAALKPIQFTIHANWVDLIFVRSLWPNPIRCPRWRMQTADSPVCELVYSTNWRILQNKNKTNVVD